MLMTIRAYTEGCRAFGGWVAQQLDLVARSADPAERAEAEDFTALMTPIVKALFTDLGFEMASLGMQVYGGHGYIRDHGMEQYVRDARISMIYEGTNGIQALDLVGRKLPANMGRSLRRFFHPVSEYIAAHRDERRLGPHGARAGARVRRAAAGDGACRHRRAEGRGGSGGGGDRLPAAVRAGGARLHVGALGRGGAPQAADGEWRRAVLPGQAAHRAVLLDRLLPQAGSLYLAIKSGKGAMMAMDEAMF